ncbi:protein of unknown function [Candidatus Filomicrobium marinum]|uniref:Uncharacterized protein n=1 Tax=Candidatus Filomicrobium marinum TaxID=1608628 RepID=A0A0D6JB95_9HYPH|nr:protein of unknown function [Candidatus Filomicrobium marinum]CPR16197.1 protein of unknown function [Candidatus Filomicrobium marinum]
MGCSMRPRSFGRFLCEGLEDIPQREDAFMGGIDGIADHDNVGVKKLDELDVPCELLKRGGGSDAAAIGIHAQKQSPSREGLGHAAHGNEMVSGFKQSLVIDVETVSIWEGSHVEGIAAQVFVDGGQLVAGVGNFDTGDGSGFGIDEVCQHDGFLLCCASRPSRPMQPPVRRAGGPAGLEPLVAEPEARALRAALGGADNWRDPSLAGCWWAVWSTKGEHVSGWALGYRGMPAMEFTGQTRPFSLPWIWRR